MRQNFSVGQDVLTLVSFLTSWLAVSLCIAAFLGLVVSIEPTQLEAHRTTVGE